jgi:hypothetical protein
MWVLGRCSAPLSLAATQATYLGELSLAETTLQTDGATGPLTILTRAIHLHPATTLRTQPFDRSEHWMCTLPTRIAIDTVRYLAYPSSWEGRS